MLASDRCSCGRSRRSSRALSTESAPEATRSSRSDRWRSSTRALIVYSDSRRSPGRRAYFEDRGPSRVTFSAKTLSLLVLISMGLSGLALLVTATGSGRRARDTRGPIHLDDALRGILEGQGRAIQRLERAVRGLQRLDGRRKESIEAAVRNVGLVRYDAFRSEEHTSELQSHHDLVC